MESPSSNLSDIHLLELWRAADETVGESDRREALWEYWRRVAEGQTPFRSEEYSAALESPLPGRPEVVGALVRADRLPREWFLPTRRALLALPDDSGLWGLAQLNAREALGLLEEGGRGLGIALDTVSRKGVAWAALEAAALLSHGHGLILLELATARGEFTRSQLRSLASAVAR